MSMQKYEPTIDQVQAAKNVFAAMALVETLRPIVEGYTMKVIRENNYQYDKVYADDRTGQIRCVGDSWMMSDDNTKKYCKQIDIERIKAKLRVEVKGSCPLLEAKALLLKAERVLVESMEPVLHISTTKLLGSGLDNYRKFIDLTLKYLVNFIRKDGE